jgi:hypothetical protein
VNTVSKTFRIVVGPAAAPADLAPVAHQAITEGDTPAFRLVATDFDGDRLTYFSRTARWRDARPNTGEFIWTAGFAQAAFHDIDFRVSDGTGFVQVSPESR